MENLCILNNKDIAHATRSDGEKFVIEGPAEYMPAVGESIVFVVRGPSAAKPLRPWSYYDRLGSANEQSLNSKIFSLPNHCSPISTHDVDENETADSSQHSHEVTWRTTLSQAPSETASTGGLWGYLGSLFDTRSVGERSTSNHENNVTDDTGNQNTPPSQRRGQSSLGVPPQSSPGSSLTAERLSRNGPRPAVPWSYYSSMAQNNFHEMDQYTIHTNSEYGNNYRGRGPAYSRDREVNERIVTATNILSKQKCIRLPHPPGPLSE